MRLSYVLLSALLLVLAACATSLASLDQLPVSEYVGHYTGGLPGESWFRRCGSPPSDSAWWVTWTDRSVAQADSARRAGMLVTARASFVRIRAAMTTGGEIGPGGPGRPALLVRELLEARPAREGDCEGQTPGA